MSRASEILGKLKESLLDDMEKFIIQSLGDESSSFKKNKASNDRFTQLTFLSSEKSAKAPATRTFKEMAKKFGLKKVGPGTLAGPGGIVVILGTASPKRISLEVQQKK